MKLFWRFIFGFDLFKCFVPKRPMILSFYVIPLLGIAAAAPVISGGTTAESPTRILFYSRRMILTSGEQQKKYILIRSISSTFCCLSLLLKAMNQLRIIIKRMDSLGWRGWKIYKWWLKTNNRWERQFDKWKFGFALILSLVFEVKLFSKKIKPKMSWKKSFFP